MNKEKNIIITTIFNWIDRLRGSVKHNNYIDGNIAVGVDNITPDGFNTALAFVTIKIRRIFLFNS